MKTTSAEMICVTHDHSSTRRTLHLSTHHGFNPLIIFIKLSFHFCHINKLNFK